MLDLKKLQNDFDSVATKLKNKKVDELLLKDLSEIFTLLKKEKMLLEELQAFQNKFSKELAKAENKEELKQQLSENKTKISTQNQKVKELEERLENLAFNIPNIPDDDVIVGDDEDGNLELKRVLTPPSFDFEPREHFELGEGLEWLDFCARG